MQLTRYRLVAGLFYYPLPISEPVVKPCRKQRATFIPWTIAIATRKTPVESVTCGKIQSEPQLDGVLTEQAVVAAGFQVGFIGGRPTRATRYVPTAAQ